MDPCPSQGSRRGGGGAEAQLPVVPEGWALLCVLCGSGPSWEAPTLSPHLHLLLPGDDLVSHIGSRATAGDTHSQ